MTILDFTLKRIYEAGNYLSEEIKQNELMSEKHEKIYRALNYFEYFLICISTVSGCVSISAFYSLVGVL